MIDSALPLTSAQQAIWFDQLLHGDEPLYNMSGYMRILGPVVRERFEAALVELVRRNDALRIVLHTDGDLPRQEIRSDVVPALRHLDFSELPDKDARAQQWMMDEVEKPPRMLDCALFDNALIKMSDDEYWWFHTYHHIISDAYGHSLIAAQLAAIYSGLAGDLPVYSYVDYIRYDRDLQASPRWADDLAYWAERFAVLPAAMIERKNFGERIEHRRHVATISRPFYERMGAFAAQVGVSTFHVILGGLYVCFTRATGREDFVIGLPTLNRPTAAFKATVGLFTNVTPAWFELGLDLSSSDLLKGIAGVLRRDYRHQRIPLSEINRRVGLYGEGRPQMFDVVLSYQNHSYDLRFDHHAVEQVSLRHGLKTPLMIEVSEYNQERDVAVNIDYSTSAFTPAQIEHFGEALNSAIAALIDGGATPIRDLPIAVAAERTHGAAAAREAVAELPRSPLARPELESALGTIWREELDVDRVGLDDNVFDMGGNSLTLVRVARRIATELGCELTITQMFMYPTIRVLAAGLCGGADTHTAIDAARERGAARRQAASRAGR